MVRGVWVRDVQSVPLLQVDVLFDFGFALLELHQGLERIPVASRFCAGLDCIAAGRQAFRDAELAFIVSARSASEQCSSARTDSQPRARSHRHNPA
ncbi:MAG: hypothetical protein ACI8UD_003178 [Planctomycetota bacterium]|jgi:hypothetical protein